jgi:cyanate lyase
MRGVTGGGERFTAGGEQRAALSARFRGRRGLPAGSAAQGWQRHGGTLAALLGRMNKSEMTELLLAAKKRKGLTWAALAESVGCAEVFLASCCYGENSMTSESAARLCQTLDLDARVQAALVEFPTKGNSLDGKVVPTDPLLYRFYEILCVYGTSLKDVIQEKCGDGIMSAIDFTLDVEKEENPKGDRVVVRMNGKFLPYRRF